MGVDETSRLRGSAGAAVPAAPPALELIGLGKRYGDAPAVRDVNLAIPPGAFLVLLGPSGCGKSTLLRMLAGLEAPSEGVLRIAGREVGSGARGISVPPGERGVGLVFQSYALWPHMTVQRNVEWPLEVAGRAAAARRQRAAEVLGSLGIAELAQRYPGEISGGQQQRVAIARMLAPAPALLLFDEPLSNLDARLRLEMRAELLRVHRESGATSVYVTHDQVEAMTMASHVAVLNHGVVEQFGAPDELLERPASAFVATFVGTPPANVVAVRTSGGRYLYEGQPLADVDGGPDEAQLMYRATDLVIAHGGTFSAGDAARGCASIEGLLVEAAPMAGLVVCTVLVAGTRLAVVASGRPAARPGETVRVLFPPVPRARFAGPSR